MNPALDPARFEGEVDGRRTGLYRLNNGQGLSVAITNLGAKVLELQVPDRHGQTDNVVLGYPSLADVLAGSPSMGAFIAPYAGRIGHARFTAHGRTCTLGANDGPHCLHGGPAGSRHRVFEVLHHDARTLQLRLVLPAHDTGWPADLRLDLSYQVDDDQALRMVYRVSSDGAACPVSVTSHAFFNLAGAAAPTVDDHWLQLWADETLVATPDNVATGERLSLAGHRLDLRAPRRLGDLGPVDSAFVLSAPAAPGEGRWCARLGCDATGRVMDTWSTEPVLQLYTGDKLPVPHPPRAGVCLEPQHYPNAPNCQALPVQWAEPGRPVRGSTRYRFGVDGVRRP